MVKVRHAQSGFSLVELMITLTLSLFLIGGLYAAMIGDQRSYEASRANQALVEKNRMSLHTLKLYIQQAGFREYSQLFTNAQLPSAAAGNALSLGLAWDEAQSIQASNNVAAGGAVLAGTDSFSIRYFGARDEASGGNGNIYLCDGSELAEGAWVTVTFYISTSNQLICRDSQNVGSLVVFDEDIENMQLHFGLLEGNDYEYLPADSITDWSQVNRMKVALLVTEPVAMSTVQNTNSYTLLDVSVAAATDATLRQVVTKTILLPNVGA